MIACVSCRSICGSGKAPTWMLREREPIRAGRCGSCWQRPCLGSEARLPRQTKLCPSACRCTQAGEWEFSFSTLFIKPGASGGTKFPHSASRVLVRQSNAFIVNAFQDLGRHTLRRGSLQSAPRAAQESFLEGSQ